MAAKAQGHKLFALLIDPEKCTGERLQKVIDVANAAQPDFIFVGGSQLQQSAETTIEIIKKKCKIPVVLFPGNALQLAPNADALLLLSLISGRNAEWLIGQQIKAARAIYDSKIEAIPTGYILVDGGKSTAVEQVSQTQPIAADNRDLIVATALGGEQAGKKLIYLEAGSGAKNSISAETIRAVKQVLTIPLIVGGGITSPEKMQEAYAAGADIIVVGNYLETHLEELPKFVAAARENSK